MTSAGDPQARVRLWFAGDGGRDRATLPPLVGGLLGAPFDTVGSSIWHDLRVSGYRRKLAFALRQAVDAEADGLVAAIDQDNAPARARLRELMAGRDAERLRAGSPTSVLPAALGEARPHGEAWLLDDPQAVREALVLPGKIEVPAVASVASPKEALATLIGACGQEEPEGGHLAAIASLVQLDRSRRAKETGLHDFAEDVRRELGPLTRR